MLTYLQLNIVLPYRTHHSSCYTITYRPLDTGTRVFRTALLYMVIVSIYTFNLMKSVPERSGYNQNYHILLCFTAHEPQKRIRHIYVRALGHLYTLM